MATFTDLFAQELNKSLNERIAKAEEILSAGTVKTFEDYKMWVGKIFGYRDALEAMNEALRSAQQKAGGA